MSSTTPLITIEEPNPTGSSAPFNLSVVAATPGSPALEYGPTQDIFSVPAYAIVKDDLIGYSPGGIVERVVTYEVHNADNSISAGIPVT